MTETYDNVFLATEQDPAAAKNLYIRAKLMMKLKERIAAKQLTQAAAAELFGVSQPRISDLTRGKIERFTVDMLVNMLACAGVDVDVSLQDAASRLRTSQFDFLSDEEVTRLERAVQSHSLAKSGVLM